MFGSSPIRYLTPSEEFYAQAENFIGITLTLRGPVDVGAMSEAFETLLQVHPAHAGHLDIRAPTAGTKSWSMITSIRGYGSRRSATRLRSGCQISPRRWSICD